MLSPNLEVNTDTSLIDPDWEDFAGYHDQHYGLAIDYIKHMVKGLSYENNVADLIIGDAGFYVQSKNFPAVFYGDTGAAQISILTESEAQALVWEATAFYRAGDVQSLTCMYSDRSPLDSFFGYRTESGERYELGGLRTSLPLHLRAMVDAKQDVEWETDWLGANKGVLVYQRTFKGEHLLVSAPGRRQPFPLIGGFEE
ncbi:MAG: hypothetical protein AAF708_06115 [Deinococcota bacterium]